MQVIRRGAFETDLIALYVEIAVDQPAAADRFALAVDELMNTLQCYLRYGRVWQPTDDRLAGVRVTKVPGYKVLVFYLVDDVQVTVLRAQPDEPITTRKRVIKRSPTRHALTRRAPNLS